jgi:bacterioferritin-associated ferredoxin
VALKPDDTICFCFHVPLRKIESFCTREKPRAASQISECLSAGTGCGWCVPMLRKIHLEICGDEVPWWRKISDENDPHADRVAPDESVDVEGYAQGRQKYLKDKKIDPPKT